MDFKLHAPYQPTGDQPQAIEALTRGVELGFHEQVMLGGNDSYVALCRKHFKMGMLNGPET